MDQRFECPGCGMLYPYNEKLLGKRVKCKKCDKVFAACISPTSTDVPDALPALDDLTSDNFVDNVMGESLPPVENAIPQSSLKMSPPSAGASRGTSLLRKMGSTKLTKMESSALYYGSGMFVVGVLLLFGIRLGSRGRRIRDRLSGGGHSPADPTFQLIGLLMAVVSVGVIGFALRPMAPEFAESLVDTPEDQRKGKVFEPLAKDGKSVVTGLEGASAVIAEIGKSAGVVVSQRGGKRKFASAHDLRRSFGARWSVRVMPAVLQQLMRHTDIQTTMRYYVGKNAEAVADEVWAAFEKGPGSKLSTLSSTVGQKEKLAPKDLNLD